MVLPLGGPVIRLFEIGVVVVQSHLSLLPVPWKTKLLIEKRYGGHQEKPREINHVHPSLLLGEQYSLKKREGYSENRRLTGKVMREQRMPMALTRSGILTSAVSIIFSCTTS
jgi:hypothetical protein